MKYNHLTLDLYGCQCDKEKLLSKIFVRSIGRSLIKNMGMHSFGEILERIDKKKYNKILKWGSGVSYIAGIIESHVAIHTLAEQRAVEVDIFSCNPFSTEKAISFLSKQFKPRKKNINKFYRKVGLSA